MVAVALVGVSAAIGAGGVATAGSADGAAATVGGDVAAGSAEVRAEAAARRRKLVGVRDNFFRPRRTRVRRGTVVVWRWSKRNANTHNVVLRRAPRGVRRFRSGNAVSGQRFARRLRRPGRYTVLCTFHAPSMRMAIRVGRR